MMSICDKCVPYTSERTFWAVAIEKICHNYRTSIMLFNTWVWQCALLSVHYYRWYCSLMFIMVNHLCAPGSKALDYSNGMFDCQSPTSPFMGSLRALHLLEELRSVLEVMDTEERESLRCQIPDSTAESLGGWIHGHLVRCEAVCRRTSWFLVSPSPTSAFAEWTRLGLFCCCQCHGQRAVRNMLTSWEPQRCFLKVMGCRPDKCQSFWVML